MHAYEKVMNDSAKKAAIISAVAGIYEINWNVKADPVGKFLEAAENGEERLEKRYDKWGKFHVAPIEMQAAYDAWKPYLDDADMKAALTAAWNHLNQEHLLKNEDYKKWTSFYHRDHEETIDAPKVTMEDLAAWVDDYKDTRR